MDPYVEAPDQWPDFHDRLAGQVSTDLNATLPAPYYARLEMRPEIGIAGHGKAVRRIVPDVAVARSPSASAGGAVAVLDAPRTTISASKTVTVQSEPIRHAYVEVRDSKRGRQLVTLIEIVSPSNIQPGEDRAAYLQKQREILDSEASLVELDLLCGGERLLSNPFLADAILRLEPVPDYLVLVNRAWQRIGADKAYQVFPILLAEPRPCVSIPLRQGQTETPLDLQYAFQRAYDSGPYRRGMVDYDAPPEPALASDWAMWAEERIRAWRGA
jgi:hypothetical protein